MGTTKDFVKLRSSKAPKPGEWNIDYKAALAKAKAEHKFIVAAWSNGDVCGYCVNAEKCMMTTTFKTWLAKQQVYFVFQHSGDKDKGKEVYDLLYKQEGLKLYPGFCVQLYGDDGEPLVDAAFDGNTLRGGKTGEAGAKAMIERLEAVFAEVQPEPEPEPEHEEAGKFKVRLNESLTTAQVNRVLDAIDKNDGYCPCQPKAEGTKCHCDDFKNVKKIGEPCICRIYVKQSAQ